MQIIQRVGIRILSLSFMASALVLFLSGSGYSSAAELKAQEISIANHRPDTKVVYDQIVLEIDPAASPQDLRELQDELASLGVDSARTESLTRPRAKLSSHKPLPIPQIGSFVFDRERAVNHLNLPKKTADDRVLAGVVEELKGMGAVRVADYNRMVKLAEVDPNDEHYQDNDQWGLSKIEAPSAWAIQPGSASTVVAVIDTGIHLSHEDLQTNLWVNTGETAGDGIDNDGNGYIDDRNGFDFYNSWDDNGDGFFDNVADIIDAIPDDQEGHGTHVSGIIAADTNNSVGVAGICQTCKIMPLKIGGSDGYVDIVAGYYAIYYAIFNGADVINMSWGGYSASPPTWLEDAVDDARSVGIVLLGAAGNGDAPVSMGGDGVDGTGDPAIIFPAVYDSVLAVASTTSADLRSSFSDYGSGVAIAAPGSSILSTYRGPSNNVYAYLSGTSMASPMAAGVAALLVSEHPGWTSAQIESALVNSADSIGVSGIGAGRLNANQAINYAAPTITTSNLANADEDSAYAVTLSASGGAGESVWTVVSKDSGLDWLSLSSSGVLSGTPTTGCENCSISVRLSRGYSGFAENDTQTLTLDVNFHPDITTTALSSGRIGDAYAQQLTSDQGEGPLVWTVDGLPNGLSWDESTDTITGTPISGSVGVHNIDVSVSDGTNSDSTVFVLQIFDEVQITTSALLPTGITGTLFSQTLAASGTAFPVTWSKSGTWPSWLNLNSSTGQIIGTPPSNGSWNNIIATVTDSLGGSDSRTFSLTVINTPDIQTSSLPNAKEGVAYASTLVSDEGEAPLTWTVTGLPTGLDYDANTGEISGTPAGGTAGDYSLNITVTDGITPDSTTINLHVSPPYDPLAITSTSLPEGTIGQYYSTALESTGGLASYEWSRPSGSLPNGLGLYANGELKGTPTQSGTYSFTAQVNDSDGNSDTQTFSLKIYSTPTITTSSVPSGRVGVSYAKTLAVSGGKSPYTWSISSGSLPKGLTLSSTGKISGKPTQEYLYGQGFVVKVTDALGQTYTRIWSIPVYDTLGIASEDATLGPLEHGQPWTNNLTGDGGNYAYTWKLVSGALPPGIKWGTTTLSDEQPISGTPSKVGDYTFSVLLKSGDGQSYTKTYTINVFSPNQHPSGTLVKTANDPTVWLLEDGELKGFPSPGAFWSHDFDFAKVVTISTAQKNLYPIGDPVQIQSGTLVLRSGDPTVYLIQEGKKHPFSSASVFLSLGYNWDAIMTIDKNELNSYPTSTVMKQQSQHFASTKVKTANSATVYLLEEIDGKLKKRGIPSPGVFFSQGWDWVDIITISQSEMNTYPDGPLLFYRDGTLIKGAGSGTVYVMEDEKKRPINSGSLFEQKGYNWGNIIEIPQSEANAIPTGSAL